MTERLGLSVSVLVKPLEAIKTVTDETEFAERRSGRQGDLDTT